MKGIMILANGFEDVEAIATLDILRRSEIDITLVSAGDSIEVLTQSNIYIKAEKLLSDIKFSDYDFLIIPGGKAVFGVLDKMSVINEVINYFANNNKLVATICAAPHLVGKLGHLQDRPFTCFPTCETEIIGGTYLKEQGVVVSENFITAKSMYYTIEFALAIIYYLQGKNQTKKVENSIKGIN